MTIPTGIDFDSIKVNQIISVSFFLQNKEQQSLEFDYVDYVPYTRL